MVEHVPRKISEMTEDKVETFITTIFDQRLAQANAMVTLYPPDGTPSPVEVLRAMREGNVHPNKDCHHDQCP